MINIVKLLRVQFMKKLIKLLNIKNDNRIERPVIILLNNKNFSNDTINKKF